jgi:hypothetical protein
MIKLRRLIISHWLIRPIHYPAVVQTLCTILNVGLDDAFAICKLRLQQAPPVAEEFYLFQFGDYRNVSLLGHVRSILRYVRKAA